MFLGAIKNPRHRHVNASVGLEIYVVKTIRFLVIEKMKLEGYQIEN